MNEDQLYNEYKNNLRKQAEIEEVLFLDNSIPLQTYIHSANQLWRLSSVYRQEKDYQNLYILLWRFLNLYCNVIEKHNSFSNVVYRRDIFNLKQKGKEAADELEVLQKHYLREYWKNIANVSNKNSALEQPSKFRPVVLNKRLVDEFLSYAYDALCSGIEFCATLAGVMQNNEFHVTHLIIPKQTGTPDSCQTINEIDIYEYQYSKNLLTLGWIHTHPTQTAFLSSVDLKTHYGYQIMLKEAIAIVCAPTKDPNLGVFRIRDDGMSVLAKLIKERPDFGKKHERIEIKLFEECTHVKMSYEENIKYEVVDLRNI